MQDKANEMIHGKKPIEETDPHQAAFQKQAEQFSQFLEAINKGMSNIAGNSSTG